MSFCTFLQYVCEHLCTCFTVRMYACMYVCILTHIYTHDMYLFLLYVAISSHIPQFDGTHIVSGSLDTFIRVWNADTGQCVHTLSGKYTLYALSVLYIHSYIRVHVHMYLHMYVRTCVVNH